MLYTLWKKHLLHMFEEMRLWLKYLRPLPIVCFSDDYDDESETQYVEH